jgi:hypothetical protein
VKRILLEEWDPIGVADVPEAQDEYDAYVPGVHRLLIHRASARDVFDYLWQIETEHMGLCGNRLHTQNIARSLVDLIGRIER